MSFALLAAVLVSIWLGGDRWWWATALMFAPRWPWLLPAAVAATVAVFRRRWLPPAAFLVGGALLLGFRAPVAIAFQSVDGCSEITVLTMNVHGGSVKLDKLAESWPKDIDVVLLQEVNGTVTGLLIPDSWNHFVGGAGVCVASPHPIVGFEALPRPYMPGWGASAIRCIVNTDHGPIRVVGVHLRTPRDGLEAILTKKLSGVPQMRQAIKERTEEAERVREWIDDWSAARYAPLVVAGDFNTTVESRIYQSSWADMENAFGAAGFGCGATKFTRWHGVRIDHVLCDPSTKVLKAWVGDSYGSDHRPVYARLAFQQQPSVEQP